jgi:hypothetical protein
MGEFQKSAERVAKLKAFNADEVKLYTDALNEGQSAADALADKISEAGEAIFQVSSSLDSFGEGWRTTTDLTEVFARNGVTVSQFADAIVGGTDKVDLLEEALRAAGVSADDVTAIISAARNEADNYSTAADRQAKITRVLGRETDFAADSIGAAAVKTAGLGAASRRTATDIDYMAAAYEGLTAKFTDEAAWLALEDGFAATEQAIKDATTATEDQEGATRDARQAQLDLIQSVADYGQEVLKLPADKVTDIVAAVDRGDLAEANRLLDEATKARTAWINVQVSALTGALLGALTRPSGSGAAPVPGSATTTTINNFGAGGRIPSLAAAAAPARWARINGR